jgi:uncharacterized protein DUF3995
MTPSMEVPSPRVRIAAEILWRALVVVAGLHAYWLLGGTWAVHAASGGAYHHVTTGLRVQSAVIAVLLVAAALVVRVCAGLSQPPLPERVVRVAMWLLTAALALAAVVNFSASTNWERYAIGPFVLVLALLGLMVATPSAKQPPHRRSPRTDVNRHLQQGLDR